MIIFLALEEVLEIHKDQIANYGGSSGIRDLGLLQSAIAQPEATFGGKYLHDDIFHMAAAYLFHICQNHPFEDGNKRTAFMAAFVFLDMNGLSLEAPEQEIEPFVRSVAKGEKTKEDIRNYLQIHCKSQVS